MSHLEEFRYRQIARRCVSSAGTENLRLEENSSTGFPSELSRLCEPSPVAFPTSAKDMCSDLLGTTALGRFLSAMRILLFRKLLAAACLFLIVGCKPNETASTGNTSEIAAVEERIRKFKADPSRLNLVEAEKALADLNSEIKELEVREATAGGAEKDEATKKRTELREKYNAYLADFTAARVQSSVSKASEKTGEALQKAGDAVKEAAQSVGDQLKSDKPKD
jgi:hypothetical protein